MMKMARKCCIENQHVWWIFCTEGVLTLGIGLPTVSFQSWKAATKNLVESLIYE
jgi:putative ABC transport system permease protein